MERRAVSKRQTAAAAAASPGRSTRSAARSASPSRSNVSGIAATPRSGPQSDPYAVPKASLTSSQDAHLQDGHHAELTALAQAGGSGEPLSRIRDSHWSNEQYVSDVHMGFLYQPHTITALGVVIIAVIVVAFSINSESNTTLQNSQIAVALMAFFVLVLGLLVFPAGPFIRPHPLLWRFVFGVGVLYELFLLILLASNRNDARRVFTFWYPELNQPLVERQYAADCTISWATVKPAVFDIFFFSHFMGWVLKSLMFRDKVMCWVISIQWELIEILFTHMLPNFAECWWDQWILDVLITNGLGIEVGHWLCNYLEVKNYHWTPIHDIPTISGKFQRALLQFTPERWLKVRWEPLASVKRFMTVQGLIICIHIEELNAFFLKNILLIPPENPMNAYRLAIWFFCGVPCLRQIYVYMTDPSCKRLGMQAWMCVLLMVTELCIIFKHGRGLYTVPMSTNVKFGFVLFMVLYGVNAFIMLSRHKKSASQSALLAGQESDHETELSHKPH